MRAPLLATLRGPLVALSAVGCADAAPPCATGALLLGYACPSHPRPRELPMTTLRTPYAPPALRAASLGLLITSALALSIGACVGDDPTSAGAPDAAAADATSGADAPTPPIDAAPPCASTARTDAPFDVDPGLGRLEDPRQGPARAGRVAADA